jgi:hypothetical protein
MVISLIVIVHAGDHFGEYLNDQVPQDYEYPLWMKIFAEYILRLIIGGMIFFSLSGYPENRLLSFRGFIGIVTSLLFIVLSLLFHDVYNHIFEIGIKGIALLIGVLLLLGFVLQPIMNGLHKRRNK